MLEGQLTKHRRLCECVNYPSIHLHPLIQGRVTVKQVLQTSWGRWDILSLQQVLGLPRGLLPVGRTWKTSKRGAPRGHPDQISEPPQLSPLEVKEQRLYSELPQSWVKLSFGGNSFPSLVHKTLNLKLLCLGWGFMAQPRGDNLWFSGREPWTQTWRYWPTTWLQTSWMPGGGHRPKKPAETCHPQKAETQLWGSWTGHSPGHPVHEYHKQK